MGERGPEILTGVDADIRDLEFTALQSVPGYRAGYSLWGPGVAEAGTRDGSNELHAMRYGIVPGIAGTVFVYGQSIGNVANDEWYIYLRTADGRTARAHKEPRAVTRDKKAAAPLLLTWDDFYIEVQMRAGMQQMSREIAANPERFVFTPGVSPQTAK